MSGLLLLAMVAQAVPAVEELCPPHEDPLRAREHFDSILCKRQDRNAREAELARRYGGRIAAVQAGVVMRFGEREAERGYMSVQSCLGFRDGASFRRSWQLATKHFEVVLREYEWRYVAELTKLRRVN